MSQTKKLLHVEGGTDGSLTYKCPHCSELIEPPTWSHFTPYFEYKCPKCENKCSISWPGDWFG